MALLIDTPRWPWRGQLWAHMISDDSLDELHAGARSLNLRYLSFGCDHYDVPDHLWPAACEQAALVDPRDIVRSLRSSGLRVAGGKPRKAWRRVDGLPAGVRSDGVERWLDNARSRLVTPAVEVLVRPGECVVLHLLDHDTRPDVDDLLGVPPRHDATVCETIVDGRYSLELVLPDFD